MEKWLTKAIDLVNKSFEDLSSIDYRILVYIFYDHLSNRNLALFISMLFNMNKIDVYFEIDNIIAGNKLDKNEINKLMNV